MYMLFLSNLVWRVIAWLRRPERLQFVDRENLYTFSRDFSVVELVRDNFILVNDAFQKQIYQVDTKNGVILALGLETDHQPIALDYDPLTQHVYWSDNTAHVLARRALYAKQSEIILKLPESK